MASCDSVFSATANPDLMLISLIKDFHAVRYKDFKSGVGS